MPELNFAEGETILIDKPIDWTSFDVVNKLKFALKKKIWCYQNWTRRHFRP